MPLEPVIRNFQRLDLDPTTGYKMLRVAAVVVCCDMSGRESSGLREHSRSSNTCNISWSDCWS